MNNVQIVKKRLKDLRHLSENLKQTSQHTQNLDINVIKMIMNITKDVSGGHSTVDSIERAQNLKLVNLQRQMTDIMEKNKGFSNRATRESEELEKYNTNRLHRIQSRSYEEDDDNFQILQEMNKMRQENEMLKEKIKELERKQQQKSAMQNEQSEQLFKHLPYFKLVEALNIFSTKIKVNEKEYDKIQYDVSDVKITLDHISIKRSSRHSQSVRKSYKSSKSSKQPSKELDDVILDIGDICNVQYIKDYRMMVCFEDEGEKKYLFMKFENYESMHRWDTALYINFQIIKSLNGSELFLSNRIFKRLPNYIELERLQKEKEKERQRQIQRQRQRQRQRQKQQERRKNERIKKQEEETVRKNFNIDQNGNVNQQEMNLLINYLKQQQKVRSIEAQVKQLIQKKRISIPKQEQPDTNIATLIKEAQEHEQDDQNTELKQKLRKSRKTPQEKNKIMEENKNKHDQFQEMRAMQYEELEKKKKKSQEEEKLLQQLEQAKIVLKKGMYCTKYAEGAFSPHQKKVFLSEDETKVCWQDKGEKQFKYILVEDIISVDLGQVGPGILKHIGKKNINNIKCFVVIKLKTQDRKQLEFGMRSASLMQNFAEKLELFVHSLHLKQLKSNHLKIF